MVAVLEVLYRHQTSEVLLLVKVCLSNDNRLYSLCILSLEHVIVNDICMFQISRLILAGRVLIADVDHAVVVSYSQSRAVYIEPLAELVLVVETVLSDLDLDSGCLILDVKALVEVAHLIRSGHLTLDHAVLLHLVRLVAVGLVHILHLGNRCELAEVRVSIYLLVCWVLILAGEDGLELLASCEEGCRC